MSKEILESIKDDMYSKMNSSIELFKNELNGVQTGRVHRNLISKIIVQTNDGNMPLEQVSSITLKDLSTMTIQIWNASHLQDVRKALENSKVGLLIRTEGQTIYATAPMLTQERRKELQKLISNYREKERLKLRNHRKDALDKIKEYKKSVSEDVLKVMEEKVDKVIQEFNTKVDKMTEEKNKEIMS